jgi:polyhydroxyalkanoate synthase
MTAPRQIGAAPTIASRDAAGDQRVSNSSISVGFPKSASNLSPPAAAHAVIQIKERDSYTVAAIADVTDRSLHAAIGRFTSGISPAALAHAYLDWATQLTYAPQRCAQHAGAA